jgi:hypothetical protein
MITRFIVELEQYNNLRDNMKWSAPVCH